MNKRGQFFLIAALVLAGIIITLTTINISTKTPETKTAAVYNLLNEADYESSSLIDYGIYNSTDITGYMESLIRNYSEANPDTDMAFIYGNPEVGPLTGKSYFAEQTASSTIEHATVRSYEKKIEPVEGNTSIANNQVSVILPDNSTISFNLNPGENFFIVLRKESGGETIVAKKE